MTLEDLMRKGTPEQPEPNTQTNSTSTAQSLESLMQQAPQQLPTSTQITTPASTTTTPEEEPFQLRMAKASAAGEFKPKGTELAEKRATQAAADKEYRSSLWDFLNTMISNAGAGSAGVIASPMDAAPALDSLNEAKAKADEAAKAFDKQGFFERQGHELSGWWNRTLGNYGNTFATIREADAARNKAFGKALEEKAKEMGVEYNYADSPAAKMQERAAAVTDKRREAADKRDRIAKEELQTAKDGTSGLGRLALDLETGALDLGADAAASAIVPGLGMEAMALRVYGEAAREQREKGGDLNQQMLAGTKAAAIEVLTEKISGPFEKIYGKSFTGKAINKAIDAIDSKGGRIAINLLTDALGEGAEEVLADLLNPVADRALGLADSWDEAWSETTVEGVLYDGLVGALLGMAGSAGKIMQTKGTITPEDIQQIKADGQAEAEKAMQESAAKATAETTPQQAVESPTSEGAIVTPAEAETAPTVESAAETPAAEAPAVETAEAPAATVETPTEQTETAPTETGKQVERGFSENVRTDENMEKELRDDFTNDPDYYTQLSNKETLGKAQEIFNRGLDEARATVDGALANAKAGKKLSPEIVPLARMVANELTRNGEKASARRILSDLAVELTQAGQLGQAAKILRSTDAQTAIKTVQKALDKINAEVKKKWGNKAKWKAELTEAEKTMLENIDMGDEAAYQDAYKQIAKRLGKEMPATLWEKITELRRINMLLKPRTQIRNYLANVATLPMRKAAETLSGAIQDAMVKRGTLDKAQQTRTLKVSKETRAGAKDFYKKNKDTLFTDSNKWDMNKTLRDYRTYFKGESGAISKAISKMTKTEQMAFMEQVRRFTYWLLEKGDAPFVRSAYVDSLAQYMAAQGLTDYNNVPQEALDFAKANAYEATFKSASTVANMINQIKRNGGAFGAAVDINFPFTQTPANIFNLMIKYSPVGFGETIYKAATKANSTDIIDSASKATAGSVIYGLGILLRALGAITGKQDDDEDKAALDKATGKSAYAIGGRWSYDWAQPVGSLFALGAETWDAIQGQEGVADAVMNAIYSAGDSALNMSLFQNVTKMLRGYGSNTEKILNAIVEGGGTQLVPGLAGDIAALIDDTVRSSYTGGNVFQNTLAKMGMNIPGVSKMLPASVNVKGEENKRGNLAFRAFEKLVDPGAINKNEMTETDRAIYDLYEDTGDKTIFPHVAPTKFDYDGETYRMTGDERAQFQTTQGQIYYEMLDAMLDSGEWDDMSRAAKVKMLQDAAAYAQDEAKRELVEARGGEYESSQYEKISNFADGDSELAAQILSVRGEAKDAISKGKADILDRLLGDDGAYNDLPDEAKELLNVDYLGKIVDMHDNGMDAAGALTVVNTIADLKPEGDHKSVTQQQKVDAIIGTDLADEEKIAAIKTYTSDGYVEKMQAAIDAGVSLEKWSEVRNKYAEISDTEGLTAMQKATRFAAALDNDKSLTEKQRQILREQLTYSSMSTAEAKRYDELTETGMSIDTATKVTDLLASIKPLDGKTSVTQNQKIDAIINGGLSDADTWAALKVYTSDSWYKGAETAYKKGIDLDEYVTKSEAADANGKNGISQAELYAFYMQNPKANEKYCKVMLMILNPSKDWDKFLREQARAAKKAG